MSMPILVHGLTLFEKTASAGMDSKNRNVFQLVDNI